MQPVLCKLGLERESQCLLKKSVKISSKERYEGCWYAKWFLRKKTVCIGFMDPGKRMKGWSVVETEEWVGEKTKWERVLIESFVETHLNTKTYSTKKLSHTVAMNSHYCWRCSRFCKSEGRWNSPCSTLFCSFNWAPTCVAYCGTWLLQYMILKKGIEFTSK